MRGGISNWSQISVFPQARPLRVDQGRGARQKKCTGSYFDGGLEDNKLTERQPGHWLCLWTLFRLQLKGQKPTESKWSYSRGGVGGCEGGGGQLGLAIGRREREVCICYTHAHKSQPSSATDAAFHRTTSTELIQQAHLGCPFRSRSVHIKKKKTFLENIQTHFWDQFVNLTRRRRKNESSEASRGGGSALVARACVIWCGPSLLRNNRNSVQIQRVGTCKHVQRSKLKHCVVVRCYANSTRLVGFPQGFKNHRTISRTDKVFPSNVQSTKGEVSLEIVPWLTGDSAPLSHFFCLLFHRTIETEELWAQLSSTVIFGCIAIVILTPLACICAFNLWTSLIFWVSNIESIVPPFKRKGCKVSHLQIFFSWYNHSTAKLSKIIRMSGATWSLNQTFQPLDAGTHYWIIWFDFLELLSD